MDVIQIGPYPPPHGGVQTNLVAIHEHLQRNGVRSTVINITRYRAVRAPGVLYPRGAGELFRLLLRNRSDVLHLHIGGNLTTRLMLLGLLCCWLPRSRTVLTFHSGGYPSSKEGLAARPFSLRGFVLRRFDRLIAVNPEIAALFRRYGADASRVCIIAPHAFPPAAGSADLPPAAAAFFETHDPALVTVSGLELEYDLGLQMEVLGRLREKFPRAGLMIIGAGSLEETVRSRIGGLAFREHVLLCGDMPHAAALAAIARARLLLRTTLYDGDSIAVREALYLGTPVIATDNGMRPAGVNLFPVHDADALLKTIENCLAAPRARAVPVPCPDQENVEAVVRLYRELTGAE
jgi:glycosyltransferase involved in cell wall biosynthesis